MRRVAAARRAPDFCECSASIAGHETRLTGDADEVLKLRDMSLRDERARLFERLVSTAAENRALDAVVAQLGEQNWLQSQMGEAS